MAVGEYGSVSSQRDPEKADVELEKRALSGAPLAERWCTTVAVRAELYRATST